jgi:hypothetical protein
MRSTAGRHAPHAGAAPDTLAATPSAQWPLVALTSVTGPLALFAGVVLVADGAGVLAVLGGVVLVVLGLALGAVALGTALAAGAAGRR